MEKFPEKKISMEQEEMLNEVLSSAPPKLGETEKLDAARIKWLSKVAELFDKMKLSREQFKELLEKTEKADMRLINRWLELAEKREELEVHDEKKQ